MPCNDVTDLLRVDLTHADCLANYSLTKRTCGAEVGWTSLLLPYLRQKSLDAVLQTQGVDLMRQAGAEAQQHEFLYVKHLVALQEVLRAYRGDTRGTGHDACTLASIEADTDGIRLTAFMRVDVLTERIRACSHCGRCGVAQPCQP